MAQTVKGPKKFKRASLTTRNSIDQRGIVKIQCVLVSRGQKGSSPIKGNICRSITVKDSKVSEVIAAIESALF